MVVVVVVVVVVVWCVCMDCVWGVGKDSRRSLGWRGREGGRGVLVMLRVVRARSLFIQTPTVQLAGRTAFAS